MITHTHKFLPRSTIRLIFSRPATKEQTVNKRTKKRNKRGKKEREKEKRKHKKENTTTPSKRQSTLVLIIIF